MLKHLIVGLKGNSRKFASSSSAAIVGNLRCFSTTSIIRSSDDHRKRILFFGSDTFSLETLKLLHSEFVLKTKQADLCVICPPDRKTIRRNQNEYKECIVKNYCMENSIDYFHPIETEKSPEERRKIQRLDIVDIPREDRLFGRIEGGDSNFTPPFDVGVVVSFSYFLQKGLLDQFRTADGLHSTIFNIHPSLLPRYRGPAPIHHALLNGDSETGVTIMELDDKEFDLGNVIKQQRFNIEKTETFSQLHDRLAKRGAEMMIDTIRECNFDFTHVQRINQADLVNQQSIAPTRAKKVNFAIGEISLRDENVFTIYNKWRALEKVHIPFQNTMIILKQLDYPVVLDDSSVAVEDGSSSTGKENGVGALFIDSDKSLTLKCVGGKLKIKALQMENKKEMTAQDFINGNRGKLPMKLL